MITIGDGTAQYEMDEARNVIAGYAFAQEPMHWKDHGYTGLGHVAPATSRRRWAYQSYDCVPASDGPLDLHDLLLTAGLNSRINAKTVLSMQMVASEVSDCLDQIESGTTFWDLPASDIAAVPVEGTPAWWLWRAWWLLDGVPGAKVAVAHKTLHHKRPKLFPLLDGKTRPLYSKGQAWPGIHRELNTHAEQFAELEAWFAELAARNHGVALSRLRLHDILLWCHAAEGQRDAAAAAGRQFV